MWLVLLCSGDVDEYKGRDDYDAGAAAAGYDYDDDVVKYSPQYAGGQYAMQGKRSDSDTFV